MLKELNKYENLGTPKFFHELFERVSTSDRPWTEDDVKKYFHNRIVEGRMVFDGCVALAKSIGAVSIDEIGRITVNPSLRESLINDRYLSNKLVEMIVSAAKNDDLFHEIFCSENISYDIIYRLIQIENSAFGFRYGNFRQLLISFGFLYPHPDKNIRKFIINSRFKKLFDSELMPEIKKRKIGIDELQVLLEQKQINGREAEIFVVKYEKARLSKHPRVESIEMISEYDVGAGYDVVSYEDLGSPLYDRFVEVKSYSGVLGFHWSRNEIDVARLKKNQYYLYLVDRSKMSTVGYDPVIVQNPYEKIMTQGTGWDKKSDGYFITQSS